MHVTEWDMAAVERKFNGSWAFTTIANKNPKWRWIKTVHEDGWVSCEGKRFSVKTMCSNNDEYEFIQFYYRPINVGWVYTEKHGPVCVTRGQTKCFKIGLCPDTYSLSFITEDNIHRWSDVEINPDVRVFNFKRDEKEIYSPFFWRDNHDFYFLTDIIGFADKTTLFLNKPSFLPHVKKALGVEWLINC